MIGCRCKLCVVVDFFSLSFLLRHEEQKSVQEDAPFGKADKHVIEARMEIEAEEKAMLERKGDDDVVVAVDFFFFVVK